MKKFKLFAAITVGVLTLALASLVFVGCGPDPKDFVFEAEDALLTDPDGAETTIQVEEGKIEYGTGNEVTNVGYFTAEGASITWVIKSSHKCEEATLKLRLAAATMDMQGQWPNMILGIKEVDLGAGESVELTVNDTKIALSGKLDGLSGLSMADMATMFSNFKEVTVKIPLKKGENKIVLTALGDGMNVNVDKITINAGSELTMEKTDNSDRVGGAQ